MPRSAALLACLLAGCETTMYYPAPLAPTEGWEPPCATVAATVTVENTVGLTAELHELVPSDSCRPSFRGAVAPGEVVDLGAAEGSVWRAYDPETGDWLGTFVLADGENALVLR